MSLEPTGVHGLLKRHKLFTHKYIYNSKQNHIKHYNTKYTGIGKLIEMLSKNLRKEDR